MPFADISGDMITIKTEHRDKDLIRALPGALYNAGSYVWEVPLSWPACLALRGLFRERLEISPGLNEWAGQMKQNVIVPALEMRVATSASGDPDLYEFQRAGVAWMSHIRTGILTDEMGTGKTVQSIRTLVAGMRDSDLNPFPALIIAPNSMKKTWQKEFNVWWPGVKVVIMESGRVSRLKQIKELQDGTAHVLVTNWEGLRGHSRLAPYGSIRLKRCVVCDKSLRMEVTIAKDDMNAAGTALEEIEKTISEAIEQELEVDEYGDALRAAEIDVAEKKDAFKKAEKLHAQSSCERCPRELNNIPWVTVIADEAHRMKEPAAKQTRALWSIPGPATILRFALTGTPIADAPDDIWCALHFIDPKAWPVRSKWVDRYCLRTFNPFGGTTIVGLKPETRDEFFASTDPYVRRMPKSVVLSQLPPKIYSTRYVEMSPKQAAAYKAMKKDMIARLDDTGSGSRLVAPNPLTQLTRLGQFASAYAELVTVEYRDPQTGVITPKIEVRLTDPSNKVDTLLEILEEAKGKPLGVFAQSRQLIELASARLEKQGMPHGLIVGEQSTVERQYSIDQFQAGRLPVILATVAAGGVGITLTRGDTCVFLQRSWSMIENKQAEDRFHRIGSEIHECINIIDIVSRGTVEEGQRDVLEAKSDRMQEVVRDQEILDLVLGMEFGT